MIHYYHFEINLPSESSAYAYSNCRSFIYIKSFSIAFSDITSFIAADLHGFLGKLLEARAEFVSISCHFQFDFEVRKGAKDSEKANPLRASRSPRQSTAARPRYDFSQNRSTTHRERPRWRGRCDAPKRGPPQSTVASSRPRRLQGMPQTQMQKLFPKTLSPPPPELCSITFREGFQNRIGSVTFREGLQKRIGPVTFGGGNSGVRGRDAFRDALRDGDGVEARFGSESSFRKGR